MRIPLARFRRLAAPLSLLLALALVAASAPLASSHSPRTGLRLQEPRPAASPAPAPGGAERAEEPQALPRLVALVRHAEKASAEGDPELSAAGIERARELARLLGGSGVTHLFASPTRRARATAEPLAQLLALEIAGYDPRDLEGHARALRDLPPGSLALSVGHSNTVPALAALLGAPLEGLAADARFGALLPEHEHDRLVLLVLSGEDRGPARRVELRFGK